jgi:NADPH:quinone reductase-like Zn-dependent oxidoreductase
MNVSWFHHHGAPEVLVAETTTVPVPGPDEALVRVRATGVNHVDIDVRAGTSRVPIRFPHILGREFAGEIAALGGPAGSLREGDRVWVSCRLPCGRCEFCITGRDNLCERGGYFGMDLPGGYAQYVAVPIRTLNPLAANVSFEQAAASQIAFGTAWHVLITRGKLRAGQSVLIQAAGSGIGSAAVQVARLAGATIIASLPSRCWHSPAAAGSMSSWNMSAERCSPKASSAHASTEPLSPWVDTAGKSCPSTSFPSFGGN